MKDLEENETSVGGKSNAKIGCFSKLCTFLSCTVRRKCHLLSLHDSLQGVGHLCSLITEDEEQKFPCRLDFAGRNLCNSLTRNFTQKMSVEFLCCPLRLTHSILVWFVHGDVVQRCEIQISSSLQLLSPFSFNLSKLKDQQVLLCSFLDTGKHTALC